MAWVLSKALVLLLLIHFAPIVRGGSVFGPRFVILLVLQSP